MANIGSSPELVLPDHAELAHFMNLSSLQMTYL